MLRRPRVAYADLGTGPAPSEPDAADTSPEACWRADPALAEQVGAQVEVQVKYAGYLKRQRDEVERHRRHEQLRLPTDIDYGVVHGLSNEARQRLAEVRPETIGQAARIPGLTPAASARLLGHLKTRDRAA